MSAASTKLKDALPKSCRKTLASIASRSSVASRPQCPWEALSSLESPSQAGSFQRLRIL